jgi:Zn-dependent protease
MINKKEIFSILSVTLVLSIIISLVQSLEIFITATILIFLVIMINIIAKKITSFYLDTEIEIKPWEITRFWIKKHHKFKKPLQAGIILPLILKVISAGIINWMACLVFEASGKVYRAARKHGIYSFSEVSEEEIGWIAGSGIIANILFAIIGYLIGSSLFAELNIMFAFYNMIPFSDLDGSKIFFGNTVFWAFLATLVSLGVLATILIV